MGEPSLTGRTVLELGGYVAAPFAGRMLAQLGADVIKIEALAGDTTRHLQSPGTFIAQNIGKRSVCLNLRSGEGRAIFDRLLTTADVVLHNLARDAVSHLDLSADKCQRVNPDIVYCHITAYGPGPFENAVATNATIEASMGVMFNNRDHGRPIRQGLSYYDMAAGTMAVIGILSALATESSEKRSRTVEVPLYETGLYLGAAHILTDLLHAPAASPIRGRSEFTRPGYAAYETADSRWIYILMLTDNNWRQFCDAMSLSDQIDPLLTLGSERLARPAYVDDLVSRTIQALPFDEVARRLKAFDVGFEEVRQPADVLDHAQAQQPGKLSTVPFDGRDFPVPNFPILSGSVRADLDTPPPLLGQHTREIMGALGYDDSECEALLARGVIGVVQ